MNNVEPEFDDNGMDFYNGYFNAGGAMCKSACYAAHPFNTSKQQDCLKGCTDLKVSEKQQKYDTKHPQKPAPTPTSQDGPATSPAANPSSANGPSPIAIIGFSVAGLAIVGTVLYFAFRR